MQCRTAQALLDRLVAIHDHRLTDDEGGGVRTEPEYSRGDLLGLSHPPDRFLRDHLRARTPAPQHGQCRSRRQLRTQLFLCSSHCRSSLYFVPAWIEFLVLIATTRGGSSSRRPRR
jgi:hypothetical protein